jgi:hypothetical protein
LANPSIPADLTVTGLAKYLPYSWAEQEQRSARTESLEIAAQRLERARLARGKVGDSHTPGNHTAETALAGWACKIRTEETSN